MTVPPATCLPVAAVAAATRRVLIVGGMGFIGQFVVEASLSAGHSTFVLLRGEPIDPNKASLVGSFRKKGATILNGAINEKEVMEKILEENEIEIVISAVGGKAVLDQLTLVDAMKSVKTIKRFLPSEFGHDVDRADPVEPGLRMYEEKRKVRRMIEESGIPYTYICCNSIASWPYHDNCHPAHHPPPLDLLPIYGDGTIKAYFVDGADIGKFTIKAADDVRTIHKNVHFRPQNNFYCINELASLWESKVGHKIPRVTVSEEDLLAVASENRIPESVVAAFTHDIFIKGCQLNFPSEGPRDIDINTLYPGETFRSLEDCYEDFAQMIPDRVQKEKSRSLEPQVCVHGTTALLMNE